MPDQITLLRIRAVLARTGLSRSQLFQLVAAGKFPRPVSLAGTAAKGWSSAAVNQWIEQQLNTQDASRA